LPNLIEPLSFGFPGEHLIFVERVVTQPWLMDIAHLKLLPLIFTVLVTVVSILSCTSSSPTGSSPGPAIGGHSSSMLSGQAGPILGQILVKPWLQAGGAEIRAAGQSQTQSQSLPSSGQSQLHPQGSAGSVWGGVGATVTVVGPTVSDPTSLVVLVTAAVDKVGHSTDPPIPSPLPFLILKLRRKEQPSSAVRLRSFTVAALFLGLQDMEDSWVSRSLLE